MAGDPHFTMSGLKFMANATFAIGVAPSLFMDGAYWSIVAELTFYFWIAALIATGVFAKRLTMAMVVWLLISAVCQMQPSSVILEHLFLAHSSGFFAAGVMIYVWREIERSPQTALVLSLATGMAALQSLHEAQWFEEHAGAPLQPTVVAGLSIACVLLVLLASSLRGARLPPRLMMALGGVTYPLYLLHQNIGYILFNRYPDAATPLAAITGVSAIMLATAFIVWRFVDIPGQRAMRRLVAPLAAWAESRAPKTSASRASAA